MVCMTQREADCLVTFGANCRTVVLPCAVEELDYETSGDEARQALGFCEDELVVLFLGRVDRKKGFPVLIPAFKRLITSGVEARLLIVGPDSRGYAATVRRLVKQLNLNEQVEFRPPVQAADKVRLLRAADCFVLPSLNENLARAAVEAMQQGLPCVISNNVYICDEVKRAGAGLVCSYDVSELFSALLTLAKDKATRASMGVAAVRLAKAFAPDALEDRYRLFLSAMTNPKA